MVKRKLQKIILIILIGIVVVTGFNINSVEASSSLVALTSIIFEWSAIIWPVAIVGGSIVLTLSYVSWRKYKGNQKKDTERQND